MTAPSVLVAADTTQLVDAATGIITQALSDIPPGTHRSIALAGGSTPRAIYAGLVEAPIEWDRVTILFGDERCVPPDDPRANYRMACEALLDHIVIPRANIHRIPGELTPRAAQQQAERDLRAVLGVGFPAIDLVLLGIGADGHTASLFPGGPELAPTDALTVLAHRPELDAPWRVSMSLPLLQAARTTLMIADDPGKAPVVARAIAGDPALPAALAHSPSGVCQWLISRATASDVPEAQQTPLPYGSGRTPPPGPSH